MIRGRKFTLDRRNRKLMGVCAGIANYLNVDVTIVRVALVLVTLLGAFPWTLVAYGAAAFVARDKRPSLYAEDYDAPVARIRVPRAEIRESVRDIDRRLAEVETFVTSPNNRLASEIEQLR